MRTMRTCRKHVTAHINKVTMRNSFQNHREPINDALAEHQGKLDREDWCLSGVAADLQRWAGRMVLDFKLEIGTPALFLDKLGRRYGHYVNGRNGFGISDEIGIDVSHIKGDPYWDVLGTLLHELLHAWQYHHGRSAAPGSRNYHNKEFRRKAGELGLVVDERGRQTLAPPKTPFLTLLENYGIEVPDIVETQKATRKAVSSVLRLYQCQCPRYNKIRAGHTHIDAVCRRCQSPFKLLDG